MTYSALLSYCDHFVRGQSMRLPGSSMHPVHPASVQILYRFTSPQFLQIKWSPSSKDLRTNEIRITFYIILSLVIFKPLLQNHHQTLTPKISRKMHKALHIHSATHMKKPWWFETPVTPRTRRGTWSVSVANLALDSSKFVSTEVMSWRIVERISSTSFLEFTHGADK